MRRKMNTCDLSDLDVDALLPPRKRLLAGLKKQRSDVNFPLPSPSTSPGSSEFDARLNLHMRSLLSNPNMSNEEIVEASVRAAAEAAKTAAGARAIAEDKAAKAAKAVAAAKSALALVATLSEKACKKDKRLKKNNLKKHIPVESLYIKSKRRSNCRTDEEVARNLHQSINSSPRISKNFSTSDLKNKRIKVQNSASFKRSYSGNEGPVKVSTPTEGPVKEIEMKTLDLNSSKSKTYWTKFRCGEMDSLISENAVADSCDGKKRGRVKQKKLPLSVCSFRDQTGSKEQQKGKDMTIQSDTVDIDSSSMWKCQSFKTATIADQNKALGGS